MKPVDVLLWCVRRVVNEAVSKWARFTREYVPCAHQGSIRTNAPSDITLLSLFNAINPAYSEMRHKKNGLKFQLEILLARLEEKSFR